MSLVCLTMNIMNKIALILVALLTLQAVSVACNKEEEGVKDNPETLGVPAVESVSTAFGNKAVTGQELVITGKNFSQNKEDNSVLFDDIASADILDASQTRLAVRIPGLVGRESVKISVRTDGGTSNAVSLDVDSRRCDSVEVFKGAKFEELRPGVTWTSTITTWKGEPRSINIITIPPAEIRNLHFTYPSGMKKTSAQCLEADALLGINGQYFDNSSGGTGLARDFLKIDGAVASQGANNRSATFASVAFVFTSDAADIKPVGGNEGARSLEDENAMVCGPLLIDNGKYCTLALTSTHNTESHPRTAVAVTESGHILLVTIDGRFPGKAVGMPTPLMQEFFTILGARSVLNLDGGGSTTMYVKGKGVVNHGSDGTWDTPKERAVNSIIYLK